MAIFSSLAYAEDAVTDIVDRSDYDPNTPYYQIMPPSWAFGLRATNAPPLRVFEIFGEKLLHYQKLGVFSLGASLGTAPTSLGQYENLKYSLFLRYQLHFMKNQILVPTVAFAYEGFRLKDPGNNVQSASSVGVIFGAMLNLGFFDSETARHGHESMGLLRSYLTAEYRPQFSISNSALALTANLLYLGLRLEVE
jgi:hypothetical protein